MGRDERANPFAKQNRPDGVCDARGRILQIDDEVILNLNGPVFYRVVGLRPALDPKMPPGGMIIEVAAAIHFICPKGVPQSEFIRVRSVQEAGPSKLVRLPEAEVVADTPGEPEPPKLVTES